MKSIPASCLILLLAASHAAAQSGGPSFDCRKASTPVEKAICADPKLSGLDRRVARDYAAALKRLDAKGAAALRQDQRSFQAVLAYGLEHDEGRPKDKRIFDLDEALLERANFLAAIGPAPAERRAGTWSNHFGGIEIEAKGDRFQVSVNAAMPVTGNWVCNVEGVVKAEDGRLAIIDTDDGKPNGWTYRLQRDGDRIVLSQHGPDGKSYGAPVCGHNGSMEGSYFLAAKPAKEGGGAIAPQRSR